LLTHAGIYPAVMDPPNFAFDQFALGATNGNDNVGKV